MKQAHCIYQDDEHRWLAIARDPSKPGYIIDTNEYVIVDGNEALLCDPGGIEIFPSVFSALSAATGVQLTLDSYHVHSVGIGADARGEANLGVRHEGNIYEGTGTSRDIIEASALAWLDVANRLLRQRRVVAGSEQLATA